MMAPIACAAAHNNADATKVTHHAEGIFISYVVTNVERKNLAAATKAEL